MRNVNFGVATVRPLRSQLSTLKGPLFASAVQSVRYALHQNSDYPPYRSRLTKNSTDFQSEVRTNRQDSAENSTPTRRVASKDGHFVLRNMSSSGFFVRPKRPGVEDDRLRQKKDEKRQKKDDKRRKKNDDAPKKPFDKKLWRLKRYSKKYKLEQWEEKRRKVMLREYRKRTADEPKTDVAKYYDEDANNDNNANLDIVEAGTSADDAPELTPRERREKKRLEREQAVKEAKKRKMDKYRKLSKRTKKSQPIMKYRMEMLLEEIQGKLEKE